MKKDDSTAWLIATSFVWGPAFLVGVVCKLIVLGFKEGFNLFGS